MYFFKKDILKTVVFALVVSVAVVFSLLEIKKFQSEEEQGEIAKRVIPYGSVEINKVEFQGAILERDGQKFTWKMISPITDYLNYQAVEDWVSKALSQEGRKLSEGGESLNWDEFGLGGDDGFIKFTTIENKSTSVKVSDKEAFDGSAYLRASSKDSGQRLYSSGKDWREVFSKKVYEFRSLQLFNWRVPSPSSSLEEIYFYKNGVRFLSLEKNQDKWVSKEKKNWTFDKSRVDSYLSELQTYLHDGFTKKNVDAKDKKSTIVVSTNRKENFSLAFYKNNYAVASYRPEHTLKIDKETISQLMINPLELRSFDDVDGNLPNGEYDEIQIMNGSKIKNKFYLRENIWTVSDKDSAKKYFNGARVFIFLDKIKSLNFKRYVSDKGIYLKNVKNRIFLMKDSKTLVKYTIGQDYPCTVNDKRSKNCVLVATNKVQKAFMVALKKDVNEILRFNFKETKK